MTDTELFIELETRGWVHTIPPGCGKHFPNAEITIENKGTEIVRIVILEEEDVTDGPHIAEGEA